MNDHGVHSGHGPDPDRDVRRAWLWGWTVLEKTSWSRRGPEGRFVVERGVHTDRWLGLHSAYARLLLFDLEADLNRLRATAAGCRNEYEFRRVAETPRPGHEACRVGAQLADAAVEIAVGAGLRPDAGLTDREAVMNEVRAHQDVDFFTRSRRRWAITLDAHRPWFETSRTQS